MLMAKYLTRLTFGTTPPQRFQSLPSCDGTNSIKLFHVAIDSLAFHGCDYSTLSETAAMQPMSHLREVTIFFKF